MLRVQDAQGFLARGGDLDLILRRLEECRQSGPYQIIVIDDQDPA
jgi:hypothetical protein